MQAGLTNDQITSIIITALVSAHTRGASAGEIETTKGNIFHGAYKSAQLAGYMKNTRTWKAYVNGYMSVMPYGVTVDNLQRVKSIG